VDQDQAFWMTDAAKQDFEVQYMSDTTTDKYKGHKKEHAVKKYKTKLNSVALVRERTIPTERPPPVGEVSANFCG
jgi:hypothetical protein